MKNKRNYPEFLLRIQTAVLILPRHPCVTIFATIALCAVMLMRPSLAAAQARCTTIAIGYSYYPPFSYQDGHNDAKGASIEVAKRAFKQMNINVTMEQMPWARLLLEVKSGLVDFIPAGYRTQERLTWATYSDIPIGYERIVIIHDSRLKPSELTLNDLRSQKGLLRRGDSHGPDIDNAIAKRILKVDVIPDIEVGLRMLSVQRADYLLTSDSVARYMLRQYDDPDLSFSQLNVAGEALYAMFSQQSNCVELVEQFNLTIRNLYRQDLMPTTLIQYLKSTRSPLVTEVAPKTSLSAD
jgi:ABC-type amino acid transport substrate-binding protein